MYFHFSYGSLILEICKLKTEHLCASLEGILLENTVLKCLKFIVLHYCEIVILMVILKGTMITISHRVHVVVDCMVLCHESRENEMHCFSIVFFPTQNISCYLYK